jgi:hypothetical protein
MQAHSSHADRLPLPVSHMHAAEAGPTHLEVIVARGDLEDGPEYAEPARKKGAPSALSMQLYS